MKKIVFIFLALFLIWLFVRFVLGGPEDDWICVEGQWVKHGAPSSPMPQEKCN